MRLWDSLLLTKPPTRTSGALRFCGVSRKNKEPTSGPLPCLVLHLIALAVVSEWCQEYVNIRINCFAFKASSALN
jgi:hypothetical protein